MSMQFLQADLDVSGFPVHIPAPKLSYSGFPSPYVGDLPSP